MTQRLHGIRRGNAASAQKDSHRLGILKECELHFIHMKSYSGLSKMKDRAKTLNEKPVNYRIWLINSPNTCVLWLKPHMLDSLASVFLVPRVCIKRSECSSGMNSRLDCAAPQAISDSFPTPRRHAIRVKRSCPAHLGYATDAVTLQSHWHLQPPVLQS